MNALILLIFITFAEMIFCIDITSHSKQNFAIIEGSSAKLEVIPNGNYENQQWIFKDQILSENQTLTTPKEWAAGFYQIYHKVYFDQQVVIIPYRVEVFPKSLDKPLVDNGEVLVVPKARSQVDFRIMPKTSINVASFLGYSNLKLETGENISVGDREHLIKEDFQIETSLKSFFIGSRKAQYNFVVLPKANYNFSLGESVVTLFPVEGSLFLEKMSGEIRINLPNVILKSSTKDLRFFLIENADGDYSIHVLTGSIAIEKADGSEFILAQGYGAYFSKEIELISPKGCFDSHIFVMFEEMQNCRRMSEFQRNLIKISSDKLFNNLDLRVSDNQLQLFQTNKGEKYFKNPLVLESDIVSFEKVFYLNNKMDIRRLIQFSSELENSGRYDLLYKLNLFSKSNQHLNLSEIEAIWYSLVGNCSKVIEIYDNSDSDYQGNYFQFLASVAMNECGQYRESYTNFSDLLWASEESVFLDKIKTNKNILAKRIDSTSNHLIYFGYSTEPTGQSSVENKIKEGVIAGYSYMKESNYIKNSEKIDLTGRTEIDFRIPLVENEFDKSVVSFNTQLSLAITEENSGDHSKNTKSYGLKAIPIAGLNSFGFSISSFMVGYKFELFKKGFFGDPEIFFTRKILEDLSLDENFYEFILDSHKLMEVGVNRSSISNEFGVKMKSCVFYFCDLKFSYINIGYHKSVAGPKAGSGYSLGFLSPFEFKKGLFGKFLFSSKIFDFDSGSGLSNIEFGFDFGWEILSRKIIGLKLSSFKSVSDDFFQNNNQIKALSYFRVHSF